MSLPLEQLPSLAHYAVKIITTADCDLKADYTDEVAKRWANGEISEIMCGTLEVPSKPSRPEHIRVLPPGQMPKRGKLGTEQNRIAMIHSLTHIESVAIDLSWDIICRFTDCALPKEFYSDWIKVAQDEAKHYRMLKNRLVQMGSYYGELPVHEGLWESASKTAHDILARLAIEHMVHEARGLDVTPTTIQRFTACGDEVSASLIKQILKDEITHVAAGVKWFSYISRQRFPDQDPVSVFIELVPKYFRGSLKPPFNTDARNEAGMTPEWYLPLVKSSESQTSGERV